MVGETDDGIEKLGSELQFTNIVEGAWANLFMRYCFVIFISFPFRSLFHGRSVNAILRHLNEISML